MWSLTCSNCRQAFALHKVYRESIDVTGHLCSKKCWDDFVKEDK